MKEDKKEKNLWKIFFPLFLLIILFLPAFSSASGGNYIIIRANVNPLYIAHEPVQIQAFILVFRNGKPTDESATLHVEVKGINVNYEYSEDITIPGGRRKTYSLPALDEGRYRITLFARKGGVSSQKMAFECGVTKAPVPYDAHFSPDGKKFYFKSLRLNETGQINKNYTFTLKIYGWVPPNEATLIRTIKNVTEITVTMPSQLVHSGGIAVVEIRDKWGWINSATMDMSSFNFAGIPAQYDYGWHAREPFWSRRLPMLASAIIFIILAIIVIYFMSRWYRG